jgi:methylthioribulose-1-phosphate dehydratase
MLNLDEKLHHLSQVCRWISAKGLTPATAGNFSHRFDHESAFVSASGIDKEKIAPESFLRMYFDGRFEHPRLKPSAESYLHLKIYELLPEVDCVLHVHSKPTTILTQIARNNFITLDGLELLKSLSGIETHATQVRLPILENHQDMRYLANKLHELHDTQKLEHGFFLKGHGLYTWGNSIDEAKRHVEGIEFLMDCLLQMKLLGHGTNND